MVAFLASILFLITKKFQYDALAVAVTEVGLAFLAGNLITGSIWGRVAWGIWWAWDARLTSALVCWLLYAGYLMLRNAIEEPTQRATFAAVFSIFAFLDVPIVIFSIKWWRTQHPQPVFWGGGGGMPHDWAVVFGWQVLAVMLVGVVFTAVRLRQEEFQREIDSLRRMAHAL
jgi:heme exporter protein C